MRLLVDDDRQQAVLQCIATKDIGNLRGYHRFETIVEQGPRRMLARRAATKVVTGNENAAAFGVWLVKMKSLFSLPSLW